MTDFDALAERADMSPDEVADVALCVLVRTGPRRDAEARNIQMLAILWTVLGWRHPDHTGSVYNYAADEEITVRMTIYDGGANIDLHARPLPTLQSRTLESEGVHRRMRAAVGACGAPGEVCACKH